MTKTTEARTESLKKYLADVAKGMDKVKAFNDHKERMNNAVDRQARLHYRFPLGRLA